MKKVIIIIFAFLTVQAGAQSGNKLSNLSLDEGNKDFIFEDESSDREIIISIDSKVKHIEFSFKGEIEKGKLDLIILDPNGKKEGGFELQARKSSEGNYNYNSNSNGSSSSSSSSSSNSNSNSNSNTNTNSNGNIHSYTYTSTAGSKALGSMTKQIDNPLAGKWKVKIKANQVRGILKIEMNQQEN